MSPNGPLFSFVSSFAAEWMLKSLKRSHLSAFRHSETFQNSFFFVSKNFLKSPNGPPSFFSYFATMHGENEKGPLFTAFCIVRFFKINICRLEIRVSQAQHAISNFVLFQNGVFSMRFFEFAFIKAHPQF